MPDIEAEETVHSETVFKGKLVDLRKDTVRLHDGRTTEREIVVHPQVVGILPLLDDGRIVFVRQYRKAAERVLLEVPAGGIDQGETPEDAVRREMVEETGYRVGRAQRLCAFYTSPGFTTEYMYLYQATELTPGEPTEKTDQIEVVPLSVEEAVARYRAGEMGDAKTVMALTFALGTGLPPME
jgi:ADP-ribose pyrophosphatase